MGLKLTVKQNNFCDKYVECGNASEAYRSAYSCANMSDRTIARKALELLENGMITACIKELQQNIRNKTNLTKVRILSELETILNASIADYVTIQKSLRNIDGVEVEMQEVVFKNFEELTAAQLKAVESVKQGRNGIELKLHGKNWTIERICKMLGYDAPAQIQLKSYDDMTIEELEEEARKYEQ